VDSSLEALEAMKVKWRGNIEEIYYRKGG